MASGSRPVHGVLEALRHLLAPAIAGAGFALADASPLGEDPEGDIALLEYSADSGAGRRLLGFYEHPAARVVVGELWSPAHLHRAAGDWRADRAALHRRAWDWDADPEDLARAIVAEVTTWLDAPGMSVLR